MKRGTLILEDGTQFSGFVFGAETNTTGEVGRIHVWKIILLDPSRMSSSVSNWYGRLQRVSDWSIVLWRNLGTDVSIDWKLRFVAHRYQSFIRRGTNVFLGVPDEKAIDEYGIPRWVESQKIFASALIVSAYTEEYSHWNAVESLSSWLKRHNVPGLYGLFQRINRPISITLSVRMLRYWHTYVNEETSWTWNDAWQGNHLSLRRSLFSIESILNRL